MTPNDEIRRRLEAVESPEPPSDLLDKIHGEIPDDLATLARPHARTAGARWWQTAAAVFLLLGGGWLAWTWTQDPTRPAAELGTPERAVPPAQTATPEAERPVAAPAETGSARLDPVLNDSSDLHAPQAESGTATEPPSRTADVVLVMPGSQSKEIEARVQQQPVPAPAAAPPPPPALARDSARLRANVEGGVEGIPRGVTGGVVGEVIGERAPKSRAETFTVTAQAPTAPPSTGGTAEPNDQPYGDVFFRTYGTNPFIDTEDDARSTFGLDVDTASYAVARRYLRDGHLPPPEAIRVEEIVNAFRYGDRPPRSDDFAIHADGGAWPFPRGERYHGLRFGIRAREVSLTDRKPATLIFTVDVSGSMARENRLGLVKQALGMLLDQLDRGDRIGLVTYGSHAEVVLEPTSDREAIRRAIDALVPSGATNAEDGLLAAYGLVNRHFREGAINRIILCSDGVANVGNTGPESILARIGEAARRGIELTTVGFGMGNYNDVLMEQLANRGNGNYAYVDTLAEARRVFVENLTGTLQTIARDAKVQVEFNPAAVARYRLLGYENRDIADERFRDDSVDAGEIGAGHAVTALYELKLHPTVSGNVRVATLHLRYKDVDAGDRVREISRDVYVRDLARSWESAPDAFRLAALSATFGEVLKRSYWVRDVDPGALATALGRLANRLEDPTVDELAALARSAAPMLERERSRE